MDLKKKYSAGILAASLSAIVLIGGCNNSRGLFNSSSDTIRESNGPGPAQVYVDGGSFMMGGSLRDDITYTNDVQPRTVSVGPFMMDEHEVTNGDWKAYLEDIGNSPDAMPDLSLTWSAGGVTIEQYFTEAAYNDFPVVGVTWEQANAYCEWRTRKVREATGDPSIPPFRLPTESEWEYAAIALYGSNLKPGKNGVYMENVSYGKIYPWNEKGLRLTTTKNHGLPLANFKNSAGQVPGDHTVSHGGNPPTTAVMKYWPNEFYLYDVAGNVNEWVADRYVQQNDMNMDYYPSSANTTLGNSDQNGADQNPLYGVSSLVNDKSRVYKGGSWDDGPHWLNPATRRHFQLDKASSTIGFRTVRTTTVQGRSPFGDRKIPNNRKPIEVAR